MRNIVILVLFSVFTAFALTCFSQDAETTEIIDKARKQVALGHFKKAAEILDKAIEEAPEDKKKELRWEKERIRRIPLDYTITEEELQEACMERIENTTPDEYKKWEREGKFDVILVEGEKRYLGPSVSNLKKRYPEIRTRFKDYDREDPWGRKILAMARKITDAAGKENKTHVLPQKIHARQSIGPKPEFTEPGELVRAWLPFPRVTNYQKDIKIISSNPDYSNLDDPESPIRSVYYEQKTTEESIPFFTIEYEFTRWAIRNNIDPEKVEPYGNDEIFDQFTMEQEPHIIFTDDLKTLADKIVHDETNPYIKGKKIYEWISRNTVYSFAREYSTIPNIPMYAFLNRYGDCGQEALLFITLCRIAGVPAAWRSGWECMGGDRYGMHDWAAVYIKPWGWLPVDPYMGVWVMQESTLPDEDRDFLLDFYYGNLDPWRFQANVKNNAELRPEKKDFRSEPVDFQRGEIESGGDNLYFNEFRRRMKISVDPL